MRLADMNERKVAPHLVRLKVALEDCGHAVSCCGLTSPFALSIIALGFLGAGRGDLVKSLDVTKIAVSVRSCGPALNTQLHVLKEQIAKVQLRDHAL